MIGTVEKIGLRSTRIRTADKTLVSVPNKQMVDSVVDNMSMRNLRRAEIKLALSDKTTAAQIQKFIADVDFLNIIGVFNNATDALNELNSNNTIDLLFLDINMPLIDGLSFLKSLKNPPQTILTTAYPNHAIESYELDVLDYLLKPISFERLLQAVNKYLGENASVASESKHEIVEEKNDYIFVRSDRKMIKINFSEITFILFLNFLAIFLFFLL